MVYCVAFGCTDNSGNVEGKRSMSEAHISRHGIATVKFNSTLFERLRTAGWPIGIAETSL